MINALGQLQGMEAFARVVLIKKSPHNYHALVSFPLSSRRECNFDENALSHTKVSLLFARFFPQIIIIGQSKTDYDWPNSRSAQ